MKKCINIRIFTPLIILTVFAAGGCSRGAPQSDIGVRGTLQEISRIVFMYDEIQIEDASIQDRWNIKLQEIRSLDRADALAENFELLAVDVEDALSWDRVVLIAVPVEFPGYIYTVKPNAEVLYHYHDDNSWIRRYANTYTRLDGI